MVMVPLSIQVDVKRIFDEVDAGVNVSDNPLPIL